MHAPITATETRPLRHAVLRPSQPADRLIYPGDDDALHLGVRDDTGELVAVASFYDEPVPGTTEPAARIRGMATLPAHRGLGHGRRLVEHGLAILTERVGREPTLWCNARTTAAGYYAKLGFQQRGGEFDITAIGPHVVMVRAPGSGM
ncbi:MAG: GNAT family N-acetyltransferase, partial [Phycisphaerales bacterium]|nr:GNAT family N-acetyltransferase [Phycisphaerales bacterium]